MVNPHQPNEWPKKEHQLKRGGGRRAPIPLGFATADTIERATISTGIDVLDELLGGGLEFNQMYLVYGDEIMYEDIQTIIVRVQLGPQEGGCGSPTIIVDSANMLNLDHIADCALQLNLEPEQVMNRIYVTRAFNSSQTYDLIVNQLDRMLQSVPQARLLVVSGLPNLYVKEGMTNEGARQISYMAAILKALTLRERIITIVTAPPSQRNPQLPAGGRTLATQAQIHVNVMAGRGYVRYTLTKHPALPVRSVSRSTALPRDGTLPLSFFLSDMSRP